jgi:hypothetical protein
VPIKSRNDYIYFISSLWTHKNCVETTNKLRYQFIKKSKLLKNIVFEGGFKASETNPEYEKYKDVVFYKKHSIVDYIKKTKESIVVFNTPAVHNCHGWKLGEFFAMGKAIISTPLSHYLPNIVHGVNIHIVENKSDIENAILKICKDVDYKKKLECNSKAYYDKYASPTQVIDTIFSRILN